MLIPSSWSLRVRSLFKFIGVNESIINGKGVSNLLLDCTPFSLSFIGFAPQKGTVYTLTGVGFIVFDFCK
jgi:hypothetical protein